MIDLLLEHAGEPSREQHLRQELSAHVAAVKASAGAGDRCQVRAIEAAVVADPEGSFTFDPDGAGTLTTPVATYSAGRFETPSIATLRQRVIDTRGDRDAGGVRLWVLDGVSPATDIGSLQATSGPGTLFQVASQFNCLEAPGPFVTPITDYFSDPTQGPRASISALPGTFLRHYAAPGRDGKRFVQTTHGPQLNLLEAVCSPEVCQVRSGYLTSHDIADPQAMATALEIHFEEIRVGVHDDVPVVLGYNWDGAVTGQHQIGQVFTSTFAAGGYSHTTDRPICAMLLRAAYLGTLLAAAALRRPKVVLTLIGGGVFGNPVPLIWESIVWAIGEIERVGTEVMDVVVNGRNLCDHLPLEEIIPAVRSHGGTAVVFGRDGVSLNP